MTEFHPTRLGLIASILQSNVDKKSKPEEPAVELCNYTDVYYNDTITADLDFMKATASPDQVERLRLAGGDVIITKDSETADDIGIPAYVESTHDSLVCGYHLTILRPRSEKVFPKFLYYSMLSRGTSEYWEKRANGVTRVSIPQQTVSSLTIPLPDLETQRRIADYLDKEISEMDAMIEEFDGLATNLRNRRSLLISKRLYAHLEDCERDVVGLWHYAITNPLTPEFKELPEGENVDFLPLENVWAHGRADYSKQIAWDGGKSSYTQFRRGDILVPKVTPTVFHGRTMIAETESSIGLATSEVHTLRAHPNADPRWIVYNMLSSNFLDDARGQIYGVAGLQRISTQYLSTFKVPLTPLKKQREIADELDREFERMDALIEESTRLIENLKARKTALITEVVTGRKEV